MSVIGVFRLVTDALADTGIPYMLTGSFAGAFHGVPRATHEIDLVIAPTPAQVRALIRRFPPPRYYVDEAAALEALALEQQFNILDVETGWKIDLIIRKSRPFSLGEFDRRQTAVIDGVQLTIATAEDVILAKLEWAKLSDSARQVEDVASLVRLRSADLDRAYLDRWIAALGLDRQWDAARRGAGIEE